MPDAGLARWQAHSAHFVALAVALSTCSFHHNSWSNIIPRNLCVVEALVVVPHIVRSGLIMGMVFPGCWGSGNLCLEKPTRVSLDISKHELCSLDQSCPPPVRVIISLSFVYTTRA